MKTGCKSKTLDQLCLVEIGKTPSRARPTYWDRKRVSGNIWLSIADLTSSTNGHIKDSREYISPEGARLCRIVKAGTLLVSFKLTLGRVAFAGTDLYTNEAIAALSVRNSKELDKHFLRYYLQSFDWEAASRGDHKVKGRTLNKAKLKAIKIPIPSLPEQKRIVSILDKALENIAKAKANTEKGIENARELFDSELSAVFSGNGKGWQTSPLGRHVHFIDYRGRTPVKTETGLRLITAKNVRMGFIRSTPAEFVDPATYDSWMTRGIPRFGDVLFTTEAPLANVAQLDTEERVVFAQRIIIMQADPSKLDSTFLKYALMSRPIQRRIHEQGTGATAKGIKASLLKKITISFPTSLREQRAFVTRFDRLQTQVDQLVQQFETKFAAIEELKRSMLHAALIGGL